MDSRPALMSPSALPPAAFRAALVSFIALEIASSIPP